MINEGENILFMYRILCFIEGRCDCVLEKRERGEHVWGRVGLGLQYDELSFSVGIFGIDIKRLFQAVLVNFPPPL